MKVGIVQFDVMFGNPEENLKKIKSLIADKEADLLVLPELANSGYLFSDKNELIDLSENIADGKFCNALKEISNEKNCYIVSGICEKEGNQNYNSSVLFCPDGKYFVYRKIHLFDKEKKWFEPGNKILEVHEISGDNFGKVKIGMMICFDWIFPETARTLALKGAQIICHPSNLVMKYCQRAMFTRALENHVFTITANRTGKDIKSDGLISFTGESVILNPKGDYLVKASENNEECIVVEIDPNDALNKNVTSNNHLFDDRRIEFYKL
jgi:predicted amidohydrolase